jgi:hypothetical protein
MVAEVRQELVKLRQTLPKAPTQESKQLLRLPTVDHTLPPRESGVEQERFTPKRVLSSFLLSPLRCGLFLTQGEIKSLAKEGGLLLPFGGRVNLLENLINEATILPEETRNQLTDIFIRHWQHSADQLKLWEKDSLPIAKPWILRIEEATKMIPQLFAGIEGQA